MGKCQRATAKGRGGTNCRRNAIHGSRYCALHSGAKTPKPGRKRTKNSGGDGCAFLVLLLTVIAVTCGVLV